MNIDISTYVRSRILLALLGVMLFPGFLSAQTNAPVVPADRYLFIVDTSSAMRRRAPAVEKAIGNLLRSSMGAQFQHGDTVGVWTFNDQLYAGRFPLQTWTPEKTELVASNTVRFLKGQTYTGESRFETVAPILRRVIAESPRLTILLVSDGDEPISGTPFDGDIRRALASKFEEQRKARMPFITVFRAARGRVASATVNLAPWPVEFPEFPPEPVVEAPKPEVKPKPEPPRPVVPNLIVIGNKKKDTEADTSTATVAVTNSPQSTPVGVDTTAPTAAVVPVPAPTNATEPAAPDAKANVPVQPPIDTPSASSTPPVVATISTPAATPPAKAPVSESPVAETPTAVTPASVDTPTTNTSDDPVVAVATTPGGVPWKLIALGAVPLVLGVIVFFILQRRARAPQRVSLITRSLDREQK